MGIFLLAVGSPERAVWLSFGFYLLNLLIPIVPAVIIYRLFPEGKTSGAQATGNSVEGSVAGWKIKAVGGASVWTIDSDFKFTNEKEQEIKDATLTNLEVEPPMVVPWGKHATIRVFSETLDPPESIRVKMQGYDPAIVVLPAGSHDGKIKLSKPVILQQLPAIASSAPIPAPLPKAVGPPIITSTH